MNAEKMLFTAIAVLFGALIVLVDGNRDNAGPDWMWCLGRQDPVRRLLFKDDGRLRRYTKVGILVGFALIIGVVWILP